VDGYTFAKMVIDTTLGYSWEYFIIGFTDLIAIALFEMRKKFDDILPNLAFDGAATDHFSKWDKCVYMFFCLIFMSGERRE